MISVLELDDGVLAGANRDNVLIEQPFVLLSYHNLAGALLGTVAHSLDLAVNNLCRRGQESLLYALDGFLDLGHVAA